MGFNSVFKGLNDADQNGKSTQNLCRTGETANVVHSKFVCLFVCYISGLR